MTARTPVESPVCHASDRIDVDFVLGSGVVVPDYGFERPVPALPRSVERVVDGEWILTPGADMRLSGSRLVVSFDRLPDDIVFENERISGTRVRRTVHIEFDETTLVQIADELSAAVTFEKLRGVIPPHRWEAACSIVADLIGWRAVVSSEGVRSRVAHEWSMRGARSYGRLSRSQVAELTFAPRVRGEDHAAVVALSAVSSDLPIDSLSQVLRQRRSPTRYDALPISLDQLAQLLGNACGVTGELVMDSRRLALRAYPSPGALYAIDAYIIPSRIEGLPGGVFRYDPERHVLVAVNDRPVDPVSFCLPDTRTVVEGISAFIALCICLPRATRKYGDVSYRILAAEAGCIAENLILVAHALGLRAGPFTGVFDALVDQAVGLDTEHSRFVVGVLFGHAGSRS